MKSKKTNPYENVPLTLKEKFIETIGIICFLAVLIGSFLKLLFF